MARRTRAGRPAPAPVRGFTYFAVLFAVALTSAGAASLMTVWHTVERREREQELLRVGEEFRRAIGSYRRFAANGRRGYPATLEDLLRDPRVPGVVRHLRRIHVDPVTGRAEWGLVLAPEGGIMGVYSLSEARPLKTGGFRHADESFAEAGRYADWQFVYRDPGRELPKSGWKPLVTPSR